MKSLITILSFVALVNGFDGKILLADTPTTPAINTPSPFAGKILLVYVDPSASWPSFVLTDATMQTIEGRKFLLGVGADTKRPNDWTGGVKTRIAWSSVIAYMELTPDEFEKHCVDAWNEKKEATTNRPSERQAKKASEKQAVDHF